MSRASRPQSLRIFEFPLRAVAKRDGIGYSVKTGGQPGDGKEAPPPFRRRETPPGGGKSERKRSRTHGSEKGIPCHHGGGTGLPLRRQQAGGRHRPRRRDPDGVLHPRRHPGGL